MALTLDAALQANQDGNIRHPLVEVKSYNDVDDIPFDGQLLTSETVNETNPSLIAHSSGRLISCYIYGPDGSSKYILRLTYTDTNRQQFYTVDLGTAAAAIIMWCSICELTTGNVGVIWIENDAANHVYRLKRRIVTEEGTNVSTAEIANWSHDTYTNGLSVIYNADATAYQLVYAKIAGSNYAIYLRSSSDFITWGAEGALSVGGLTATKKLYSPFLMHDPDHETLWLWLCYVESVGTNLEELINVYYSTSGDDGATWEDATQFTAYSTFSTIGASPSSVLKSASQMYAAYTETARSLVMNASSDGWVGSMANAGINGPGTDLLTTISHFNPVTRKLYIGTGLTSVASADGSHSPVVMMIDVDSWTIEDTWSASSTPPLIIESQVSRGEGDYCVTIPHWNHVYPTNAFFQIINTADNTVTVLSFADYAALGISKNVDVGTYYTTGPVIDAQMDEANDRLWLIYGTKSSASDAQVEVGYIDLSALSYTSVCHDVTTGGNGYHYWSDVLIYPADGYIVEYMNSVNNVGLSWLNLYDLSGALIKKYRMDTDYDYPIYGLSCLTLHNDKLYGGVKYTTAFGRETQRGIVEIDIATHEIKTYRPTFASVDDYSFTDCISISDDEILFTSSVYGAAIFNTTSLTWTQISNSSNPGLTSPSSDAFYGLAYDATEEMFFTILPGYGFYGIPIDGNVQITDYQTALYSGGAWTWGSSERLIQGNVVSAVSLCKGVYDGATYVYAMWVHNDKQGYSIYWDTEEPPFNLTPYWINGTDLSLAWSVDGSFNTLSMELAHGHLFDAFNLGSAWQKYVEKGRKLVVRLGELISGEEYWQNQGTFIVTERRMYGYERGKYPTISITAEDQRTLWQHKDVIATDAYSGDDPNEIIEDLLIDQGVATDYNDFYWTAIDNETQLEHQWMETPLLDIVNQIVDRYGYYLVITVDDKISARKIALNNALDHTYATSAQLLAFSPDDTFSDFINQIIVVGQELTYTEVTYAEECIKTLNGTIGWWGCKNEYVIYYSDDRSRVCRSPRLVVIESVTSIGFAFSGDLSEGITHVDVNELYCVVTVEAPNLIGRLVTAVILWALFHFVPDIVTAFGFIVNAGVTIRVGTALQAIALAVILNVMSAVGNFQYEIWATPVGHVRRSIQATADDEDLQNAIGKIISKKIEDPLCYTVPDCQVVANHERDVVKAQRRRASFSKVSHLQDEVGDTISVLHPFSGQTMDIFITDLKRIYRVPDESPADEASCVDEIDGWVLP